MHVEKCKGLCNRGSIYCSQLGRVRTEITPNGDAVWNGGWYERFDKKEVQEGTIQDCHKERFIKARRVLREGVVFYERIKGPKLITIFNGVNQHKALKFPR
jgi:hypothetical protein